VIGGSFGVQQLNRHWAIEPHVSREKDDSHSAAPKLALNDVVTRERVIQSLEP